MKALVPGGTGFIGSWIAAELASRDVEFAVLTRNWPFPAGSRARVFKGDCRNFNDVKNAMENCDTVIHAAPFYPDYSLKREKQCKLACLELETVLKAARETNIRKFVFISSPVVVSAMSRSFEKSTYCYIKYHLHKKVLDEIKNRFPGIIIIPGGCFGPGNWKVVTGRVILEIVSRRLKVIFEGKMNVVDVRDAAHGIVESAERGIIGREYQLGGWNCMVSGFVARVAGLAGIPSPRMTVPYALSKIGARIVENVQFRTLGGKPFLPESGIDIVRFSEYLDSTSAAKELGFTNRPVDETLTDSINWYRNNGYLNMKDKIDFDKYPKISYREKFC